MAKVEVRNLTKTFRISERRPGLSGAFRGLFDRSYREIRAVDDVSFDLESGELLGYIGPNGAGKSTTIKILAGILVPTSGTCLVEGRVPWLDRERHVAEIGVVFGQKTQLWWDLPVIESFDLLRRIYRIPGPKHLERRDRLVSVLDLGPILDQPVRQLSLGQRMRCDLAAALLHAPAMLFLDEPTIGLDASTKLAVRDFIREINRQDGVTVILTTHDMDDIEALCRRIMVVGDGRILLDGGIEDLRASVPVERRLRIELVQDEEFREGDLRLIRRDGRVCHVGYDPASVSISELVPRIMSRYQIKDLLIEDPDIDEVVAKLYRNLES